MSKYFPFNTQQTETLKKLFSTNTSGTAGRLLIKDSATVVSPQDGDFFIETNVASGNAGYIVYWYNNKWNIVADVIV